jgi:hypothetical protein
MHSLKAALIAASLLAAGTAFAAEADVSTGNVTQIQQGSHNRQKMEVGVIDLSSYNKYQGGKVEVKTGNITQTQSGNNNRQKMEIGKLGEYATQSDSVRVHTGNVTQSQSGSYNHQKMRIGVID